METTIFDAIGAVWSEVLTWLTDAMNSAQAIFYTEGALTFVGTLAVIGVAIAVVCLVVGIIQNFLRLRS